MAKTAILSIDTLAAFEREINRDDHPYDINMMVMTGKMEDKHKNIDPAKGIPALRRKFNLIFIFLGGEHDVQIGLNYHWLQPNDLVIVPENMVSASPHIRNCTGYCIHFKTEFLQPVLNGNLSGQFAFFDVQAEHIIHLQPEDSEVIQNAFRDIIRVYERFSPEKDYLLRNYIHILLLRIRELYKGFISRINVHASRSTILANQFKHLVEKNIPAMREVQQYASLMNVSSKYLNEVVKDTFGKAPGELIREMLLLEAKVLLRSTDLPASQIAFRLNFEDHSYFSRFIKQHTGFSPLELRKIL